MEKPTSGLRRALRQQSSPNLLVCPTGRFNVVSPGCLGHATSISAAIFPPDAGWHAAAVLWLEMPDEMLERTGNALLTWPETRTCAAIAGSSNMPLTLGLHAVADLHSLASRVAERFPYVRIVDRQLVMRQVKLYGRILDPSGRSTGVVPVDPWGLSESQQGRIDVPRTP